MSQQSIDDEDHVQRLSIRVSWELFLNRLFDYCAEHDVDADDLVAPALHVGLENPEEVGPASWREESFASLVPTEPAEQVTVRRLIETKPTGLGRRRARPRAKEMAAMSKTLSRASRARSNRKPYRRGEVVA